MVKHETKLITLQQHSGEGQESDCDSDHHLSVVKMKIKLTKVKQLDKPERFNLEEYMQRSKL